MTGSKKANAGAADERIARALENYRCYVASGNPTALVLGETVYTQAEKTEIGQRIMAADPRIEQVGFLREGAMEMAGGEFCGNATRCAVFELLGGEPGEIVMKTSGADAPVRGGIRRDGTVWLELPPPGDLGEIITKKDDLTVVDLQGISFAVKEGAGGRQEAVEALERLGLMERPAAGAVFMRDIDAESGGADVRGEAKALFFTVHVREARTLFDETACGSGTASACLSRAAALAPACGYPFTYTLRALQPYGEFLAAQAVLASPRECESLIISGPVKYI